MSRVRAPLLRIEKRALSIGLGLKRSSQCEIGLPEFHRLQKPLGRRERIPGRPLLPGDLLGAPMLHDSYSTGFSLAGSGGRRGDLCTILL
jgi:hypothetical protein